MALPASETIGDSQSRAIKGGRLRERLDQPRVAPRHSSGISRPAGRLVRPESTTTAVHEKTATPNLGKPTKRPYGFDILHRDRANDASASSLESAGSSSPGLVTERIQAFHKPFQQGGSGASTALSANLSRP